MDGSMMSVTHCSWCVFDCSESDSMEWCATLRSLPRPRSEEATKLLPGASLVGIDVVGSTWDHRGTDFTLLACLGGGGDLVDKEGGGYCCRSAIRSGVSPT